MRTLTALCLLACAGGCTGETVLEVTIGGDLGPGVDVDRLDLSLSRTGAEIWSHRYDLTPMDPLPLRYRIERPAEGESVVDLTARGTLYGATVIEAEREASFIGGETTSVELCFWQRCLGSDDEACRVGSCEGGAGDGDADGDADEDVAGDGDVDGDADEDVDERLYCTETCVLAGTGHCHDGGEGSESYLCEYGTDCADCGPRVPSGCVPHCEIRECGSDGCGGTCGPGCEPPEVCAPGGVCVEWVEIVPDGPFTVGSPIGEAGRQDDEDQHEVLLTRGFAIPTVEMSQRWYAGLYALGPDVEYTSYPECGLDCPQDRFSWVYAVYATFLLNHFAGLPDCYRCVYDEDGEVEGCHLRDGLASPYDCEGYRLPTEAEWEYAARGGTTTATYNGDLESHTAAWECEPPSEVLDPIAWFCGNSGLPAAPSPGGTKRPNLFGLYDMLGSMHEFVHDWDADYPIGTEPLVDPFGPPTGTHRMMRGASYFNWAGHARAAHRWRCDPLEATSARGFRPVRTLR